LRPRTAGSLVALAAALLLLAGCASTIASKPSEDSSASAKAREINLVYTGYGQGIVDPAPECT
jgi:hypothetical protein